LVDDDDLERANALIGFGTRGLEAVGPLLASALLLVTSPRGVLAVDVGTFIVSAALLVGLPPARTQGAGARDAALFTEVRLGLGALWKHRLVRVVSVTFWVGVAATAA
jgi:hypothetical protein